MKITYDVIGVEQFAAMLSSQAEVAVRSALEETMEDLRRCASGFAPKDTGHLESMGRVTVTKKGNQTIGEVTFEVTADKENYAIIMHEGFYNLGAGSQGKGGGSSKFGTVNHTVGRKYLETPFNQLLPAYIEHIGKVVTKELGG